MTARTSDNTALKQKDGVIQSYPVQQAEIIYKGVPVTLDASDRMLQENDGTSITLAAGDIFVGISAEKVDNSAGADGAKECRVWQRGTFLLKFSDTLSGDERGSAVYINNTSDDAVVTLTSDAAAAQQIRIGTLVDIEANNYGWVNIDRYIGEVSAAVPE